MGTRTPLQEWQGHFGRAYTDRNVIDPASRIDGFRDMLDGLDVRTIVEVGTNRGHNLVALDRLGYVGVGVEPGDYARRLARAQGLTVIDGDIYRNPFPDRSADLVFTSGVLIHVPPERLEQAVAELARVTRRYLLAVEYHADTDEEVPYRGRDGMLWRRDYAGLLGGLHGFTTVKEGNAPAGFDGASFAIVERSG